LYTLARNGYVERSRLAAEEIKALRKQEIEAIQFSKAAKEDIEDEDAMNLPGLEKPDIAHWGVFCKPYVRTDNGKTTCFSGMDPDMDSQVAIMQDMGLECSEYQPAEQGGRLSSSGQLVYSAAVDCASCIQSADCALWCSKRLD